MSMTAALAPTITVPPPTAADVRRIRDAIGATQVEFGLLLNVSEVSVQRWEAGGTIDIRSQRQIRGLELGIVLPRIDR